MESYIIKISKLQNNHVFIYKKSKPKKMLKPVNFKMVVNKM